MLSFIGNFDIENIVYSVVAIAGLVAVVYCTFFTTTEEDSIMHNDSNLIDDHDGVDAAADDSDD